jgi:chromosomal replication initiation ATPase DnaA
VDDVHFLAGKQATLVEFLHTIDALLADAPGRAGVRLSPSAG